MSKLWAIIQAHLDEYGVREAALARRMGTSPQTLNSWKNRGLRQLPERWLLEAVARETRTPYEDVLDAVLIDTNYREGGEHVRSASITPTPGVTSRSRTPEQQPPRDQGPQRDQRR